jgi:hypothetical protein
LSKLEYYYGARKPGIVVTGSLPLSRPGLPFFANQWRKNSTANILKYRSAPFLDVD